MAAGSIWQTIFDYRMNGQILMNVLTWEEQPGSTYTNETTATVQVASFMQAGAAIAGQPAADILSIMTESCELVRVRAQIVKPFRFAFQTRTIGLTGARTVQPVQSVNTVVIKRREFAHSGGSPLIHLPPGGADDYLNGELEATYYPIVQAKTQWLYTTITVPIGNIILRPCISRRPGLFPPVEYVVQREVLTTARVMPRRTVGRGI